MAEKKTKIDPERIRHKQSFEWGAIIGPSGKTAKREYEESRGKKIVKHTTKNKK